MRRIALLLIGLSVATSCGQVDAEMLHGTWVFTSVTVAGDGIDLPASVTGRDREPHPVLWVTFSADGGFHGAAPCNGFSGAYTFDGRHLEILEAFRNLAGCMDDDLMDVEEIVMGVVGDGVVRFRNGGRDMAWSSGDTTIVFRRHSG